MKWSAGGGGGGGGGGRNFRVMGSFQTGFGGAVGTAFPSAATFPHYAIQQGIPYNLYGYVFIFCFMNIYTFYCIPLWFPSTFACVYNHTWE